MGVLTVFVVLTLLALPVVGVILLLVVYSREQKLARRIDSLERNVQQLLLEKKVERAAALPTRTEAPRAPVPVTPEPVAAAAAPKPMDPPVAPRPAVAAVAVAKPRVSLERALGVTGAAVLGGIVFAIAGIYLYQYSVQQGLLTPAVRVALGTGAGIVCLAASEVLRKKSYRITADSLAGGAIVVLFAAFWAAGRVFHLWPFWLAFALMGVVTALCCVLALRHSSQVIAVLGLLGGFATPIALSTGQDRPIGLFGWTLLVNLGFLAVAHKRRWPGMAMLALLGTFVIEALWIFARMGPHTFLLANVVLGTFALLFVGFVALQPAGERARWLASQVGAVLLPFAFALYFAARSDELAAGHFYPTALLAALLCAASAFVARSPQLAGIPLGSAAGSVALALVWIVASDPTPALAWEFAGCCALIACVLHVAGWSRRAPPQERPRIGERDMPALVAASGFAVAFVFGADEHPAIPLWPWASGAAVLALLQSWHAIQARLPRVAVLSSLLSGIVLYAWVVGDRRTPEDASALALCATLVGFIALSLATAMRFSDPDARRTAWWAPGIAALFAQTCATWTVGSSAVDLHVVLALIVGFGALAALAASGARSSLLYALGAIATGGWMWSFGDRGSLLRNSNGAGTVALLCAGAGLFALWPFVRRRIWSSSRAVWAVAALASVLWFAPLRRVWSVGFENEALGVVPLFLAAIVGAGAWLATRETSDSSKSAARAWLASVALFWLSLALPMQLDHDWRLVGLALAGASHVWLWVRLDQPPLKYVGSALISLATMALVMRRFAGSDPLHEAKLVNWLAWSYLVPAFAAALASFWLARHELARLRDGERKRYAENVAWLASLCGLCASILVFAWINLAILNAYGTPPSFRWLSDRIPARDLSMSLAWALYALALLVGGVTRRIGGLRWVSLGLFLLTIAKVFLFDLGNLQGLYRVASLLGLAVALLLVSLLYQRFVFRVSPKDRAGRAEEGGAAPSSAEPERAR